ncbi:hypothetical protein [Geothrix sp. 21YS21S-2]|uniref:hypothetical protein n=1 Tax=Geothrix sp. 21YS21S-2 TaxID=3068893 RepID=UPI0027BAF6D9|nr:hypothetical protein [Geothrix sp. 21YS21S-2]
MLFYISLYVLAAILLFQGTQLLGELSEPREALPSEVRPGPSWAARWGGFLVTYGAAMILAGILSHPYEWFQGSLGLLRGFGVAIEVLFGLWLVFGRKVDYAPAPGAPAPAHH